MSDETLGVSLGSRERLRQASASERVPEAPGYEVEELLGSGNFGSVYRASRLQTGQRVAIKFLHQDSSHQDWDYMERELDLLLALEAHPNVLSVLDVNLQNSPPFLVTTLVEGGTLQEQPEAPLEQKIAWLEQFAQTLSWIHRQGIIHCDLKPSNLFVSADGHLQVGDFGQSLRLLHQGEVAWGTLGFMAPEQCQGNPAVSWDIYAFGATAYWLLCGRRPRLLDDDLAELNGLTSNQARVNRYLEMLQQRSLASMKKQNRRIPPYLADVVTACLHRDPDQRILTAEDLVRDLERGRKGQPLHCRRPWTPVYLSRVALRSNLIRVSLLALILLIFLGGRGVQQRLQVERMRLTQNGISALESGRLEQAYQTWARVGDEACRWRLRLQPIQGTYTHARGVNSLSLNAKGNVLATASRDATVAIWDLTNHQRLATLEHKAEVAIARFHPKRDDLLATASWDGSIRIFKGEKIDHQYQHPMEVPAHLTFSPKGTWMASGAQDASVILWNFPTRKQTTLREGGDGWVQKLEFSDDEAFFAAVGAGGLVFVWSGDEFGVSRELMHPDEVNHLDFHPQLPLMATAADDGWVRVWDLEKDVKLGEFEHGGRVHVVRFSTDGKRFASGGDDGVVHLWSWDRSQEPIQTFYHREPIRALDFDPEGRFLGVGTGEREDLWSASEPNGSARVWDLRAGKPVTESLPHDGPILDLAFSEDSQSFYTASGESRRKFRSYGGAARRWLLWRAQSGDQAPEFPEVLPVEGDRLKYGDWVFAHASGVRIFQALLSPAQDFCVTAAGDGEVRFWSLEDGSAVGEPLFNEGEVTAIAFHPSGRFLVASSTLWGITRVTFWDLESRLPLGLSVIAPEQLQKLRFDENELWGQGPDGELYRWSFPDWNSPEESLRRLGTL